MILSSYTDLNGKDERLTNTVVSGSFLQTAQTWANAGVVIL